MPKGNAAIIGYNGLIGGNLLDQYKKKFNKIDLFNSKNIIKINNKKEYDVVFCAGLPATKWLANKAPIKDKKNTEKLIRNLKNIKTKKFVLISTIDVHFKHAYGQNRKYLEKFIKNKFRNNYILRLPGVFGKGLKKNIIFDLLNKNAIDQIYLNDKFQWYDLADLFKDISKIFKNNQLGLNELYSAPISNYEIINLFKEIKIDKKRLKPINYSIKPKEGFCKNKKYILSRIKNFIRSDEK
jgi:dTDP-4-dehydrorhamnose reductase